MSMNPKLLEPIVQSHVEFLDTTRETLKEIGHTQAQQAETLEELAAGQIEIKQAVLGQPHTTGQN